MGRTDKASRFIRASAQKIYAAHVDPQAVAQWRPPKGMRAEIYHFDARVGGGYRMAFVYVGDDHTVRGKTTDKADIRGRVRGVGARGVHRRARRIREH